MSSITLIRPRVSWRESAREDLGVNEAWFEDFDQVLSGIGSDEPLSVRQDADTWYFVNDIDVSFPTDPTESVGLDTWDF